MPIFGCIIILSLVAFFILYESTSKDLNKYVTNYVILLSTSYILRAFLSIIAQGKINPDFAGPCRNINAHWGLTVHFLRGFNGDLAQILGTGNMAFSFLYSFFGLVGSCYLLRTCILYSPQIRLGWLSKIFIFFLPAMLTFTSVLSKDAPIFMCVNIVLYQLINKNRGFGGSLSLLLAIAVILIIRPYYVAIGFISFFVYTFSAQSRLFAKFTMVIVTVISSLVTKRILSNFYGISSNFTVNNLATIGGSHQVGMSGGTALTVTHSSVLTYFLHLPYMIFGNLFMPLVSAHSISTLIAAIENAFVLSFVLYYMTIRYVFRRKLDVNIVDKRAVSVIKSFAIAGVLVLAANNANLGYAMRVKYLYTLPFYVYLTIAYQSILTSRKARSFQHASV